MQEHQSSLHIGTKTGSRKRRIGWRPLALIGLYPLAALVLWWFSTAGWGWWVMHADDPRVFGPTHGNTITAVLGGGDSSAHPTTLTAINDAGQVEIKITRPGEAKPEVLTLMNLSTSDFPNPTAANIELEDAGDHIQITVLSTVWDTPFHRVTSTSTLVKDGGGHLK